MRTDDVDDSADEEGESKPNQGAPASIESIVLNQTGLVPRRNEVESPHGTNEHRTCEPALRSHTSHNHSHHTGEKGIPESEVAVVASKVLIGCNSTVAVWSKEVDDGRFVAHEVVKVPEATDVSKGPNKQSNLKWKRGFVPSTVTVSDVAEPSLF